MKLLTLTEATGHLEFAWRAAAVISFVFVAAFLLTYFDTGRDDEVEA